MNFIHFQVTFKNIIIFIKGFLKTIQTNVGGTMNLVSVMEQFNVKSLIFSSSATVYGTPQYLPLDEVCTPQYLPLNPLRGSTPGPWTPQGLYPEPLKVFTPRPSQGLCSWTHSGALRLRGCTAEPLRDSTPGPHQGLDLIRGWTP